MLFFTVSISILVLFFFFFKQKTAYEMRISDWSSDVCSSDLAPGGSGHFVFQDAEQPLRRGAVVALARAVEHRNVGLGAILRQMDTVLRGLGFFVAREQAAEEARLVLLGAGVIGRAHD